MNDPSVIRRLAFIRYLYGLALEQSKAPEPLSAASLLTFHDSVELFLQLGSERLNIGVNQSNFMDYWSLLSPKLSNGGELPQRESMRRLNKARVSLKHHGTLPSKLDIEAFRASATSFFLDSTPLIFGCAFEEITLIDFVSPDSARDRLKNAERLLLSEEFDLAMDDVAVAFAELLDDYEDRKRGRFGRSPFFFGRDLRFHSSIHLGLDRAGLPRKLSDFVDRVKESVDAMQDAIKMLALGLDYRRYSRFQFYVPYVSRTLGGTYHVQRKQSGLGLTKEDVRFCIDFVIEAAIHLRDFDYDAPCGSGGC